MTVWILYHLHPSLNLEMQGLNKYNFWIEQTKMVLSTIPSLTEAYKSCWRGKNDVIQCWLAIEDCNNLHLAPQKKWRVLNKTSEILKQQRSYHVFPFSMFWKSFCNAFFCWFGGRQLTHYYSNPLLILFLRFQSSAFSFGYHWILTNNLAVIKTAFVWN